MVLCLPKTDHLAIPVEDCEVLLHEDVSDRQKVLMTWDLNVLSAEIIGAHTTLRNSVIGTSPDPVRRLQIIVQTIDHKGDCAETVKIITAGGIIWESH